MPTDNGDSNLTNCRKKKHGNLTNHPHEYQWSNQIRTLKILLSDWESHIINNNDKDLENPNSYPYETTAISK